MLIAVDRPKPFSMIRPLHLADWLTLGNAARGVGALFSGMTYLQADAPHHLSLACGLVAAVLVFDVLDGRVARRSGLHSILGRELDSLADVISFGVAPAAIAYGCGMQGLYDRVVLVCFVACGVSRRARHDVNAVAQRSRCIAPATRALPRTPSPPREAEAEGGRAWRSGRNQGPIQRALRHTP